MIDAAVNAGKIVEALKETEAESEAKRTLSTRAVALLHEAGLTRIMRLQRSTAVISCRSVPWWKPSGSWRKGALQRHGC